MHLTGFKNALTKTFNDYAKKNKILKDNDASLSGEDIREGITAIISVKIENPQFEGQTKDKLGNTEARSAVDSVVTESLTLYLEQNPNIAKLICEKSLLLREQERLRERQETLQEERVLLTVADFLVSLQTVQTEILKTAKFSLLRVILRVVQPRVREQEQHRLFSHSEVRSLT